MASAVRLGKPLKSAKHSSMLYTSMRGTNVAMVAIMRADISA
jgi:hypothetical protein